MNDFDVSLVFDQLKNEFKEFSDIPVFEEMQDDQNLDDIPCVFIELANLIPFGRTDEGRLKCRGEWEIRLLLSKKEEHRPEVTAPEIMITIMDMIEGKKFGKHSKNAEVSGANPDPITNYISDCIAWEMRFSIEFYTGKSKFSERNIDNKLFPEYMGDPDAR